MSVSIAPAQIEWIESFRETLDAVAREKIYIEMVEAPSLEKTRAFQTSLIEKNSPNYYAMDGENVVGWCDISVSVNPRLAHRGHLGMGLISAYRGRGLGRRLLETTLEHAARDFAPRSPIVCLAAFRGADSV